MTNVKEFQCLTAQGKRSFSHTENIKSVLRSSTDSFSSISGANILLPSFQFDKKYSFSNLCDFCIFKYHVWIL